MLKHLPLLALLCASLSACATQEMVARAQGNPGPMDNPNIQPPPPMPAYYALVPLVLPFDAIAWPIQLAMGYRPGQTPPPPPYQQPPPPYGGYQQPPPPPYYQGPQQVQPYRPGQ